MNESLSHDQVRFFQEMGYLKLAPIMEEGELVLLTEYILNESIASGERKMYGLFDRNPNLMREVITNPKLTDPLQSLLGPNVVFVKNRHNHATLNLKADTIRDSRLHRDILQPTRGLITALIYLEDATIDNGCTHIIPGSQFFPFMGIPQPNGGGTWMDEHPEYYGLMDQALPVPMTRGGALLFNGLAFHTAGVNNTDSTRLSITLGFRSADELDRNPDQDSQVLVTGKYVYRGNSYQRNLQLK